MSKTSTKNQQQRVVIHMGAGVHDLTITDPESPTLRGHVLSLKQATRRQKGAVAKALCGALGIVGPPDPEPPPQKSKHKGKPSRKTPTDTKKVARSHDPRSHQPRDARPERSPNAGRDGKDLSHQRRNGPPGKLSGVSGTGQDEAGNGPKKRSRKRRSPRTVSASGHPGA